MKSGPGRRSILDDTFDFDSDISDNDYEGSDLDDGSSDEEDLQFDLSEQEDAEDRLDSLANSDRGSEASYDDEGSQYDSEASSVDEEAKPSRRGGDALRDALGSLDRDALRQIVKQFQKRKDDTEDKLLKRYENSVFKVFIHSKAFDYDTPYMPPHPTGGSGSGFVVMFEGKPCLLTNAHVADSTTLLEVRLADDNKKYRAKVKCVDHDCDLALLEVDDEGFWENAEPLEMGDMPRMRDKLQVFGFPMGGEEFCITQGQVSRIEVQSYAQSGIDLLQCQVSAAVNPGNSGGPVIQGNKVIGVAFQGYSVGDSLNYMIPPPIIKHFLRDALSPEPYKGFPDLSIAIQPMESKSLREYMGMTEDQSGVRVKKIAPLCSAKGILKEDDILLELDGHKINNDGTTAYEFSKRVHFNHVLSMKHIGDSIHAKVLREGEVVEIDFPLTNRANTTYFSGREYDKAPTYYIVSGLVMMPLTDNFIDDASGFFSRVDLNLERYAEKFKQELDQEVVFVHSILATDKTKEVLNYDGAIIKEVNGQKIRNIREAITAFEGNRDKPHIITTHNDDKLIVPNLSAEENAEILKAYHVTSDRSEDLTKPKSYRPGCPEATAYLPTFAHLRARAEASEAAAAVSLSESKEQQERQRPSL